MDSRNWEKVKILFGQALEISPDKREEFLLEACGNDVELYQEVLSLVREDQSDDSPLDSPAIADIGALGYRLSPGDRVDQYEILNHIGSGGMGDVFLAFDTKLGRKVALKFLSGHVASMPSVRARFMREARAAAGLTHPNIVTIYEVSERDHVPFIAMEYLEGRPLREVMDAGLADMREVLRIVLGICRGLSKAHSCEIVHRDIKPENVYIGENGDVTILDFGIAKTREAPDLTLPGSPLGTANYMSPEQARGTTVDHRSDIFSTGVVLYEMITGRPPFARSGFAETVQAVISEPAPRLMSFRIDIPRGLQDVVDRALAKSPDDRYQSFDELITVLSGLLSGSPGCEPDDNAALADRSGVKSVAVLYLQNLGDPGDEYLCHGITEDLIVDLTRISSIRVVPKRSILRFRNRDEDIVSIGTKLNVEYVLDGSIHKFNGSIRLSAQLVNIGSGMNVWADRWEESSGNLPQIKRALALGIASSLGVNLSVLSRLRVGNPDTSNSAAYEYYLRGKYTFEHKRDTQDLEVSLGLYKKALEFDEALIAARAGVAEVLRHQGSVERALDELESCLDLARSGKMRPDEATVLRLLAELHTGQSRWDRALACCADSVAISREIGDVAGEAQTLSCQITILLNEAKYDDALAAFDRVVEINRRLRDEEKVAEALKNMGKLYRQRGDYDRAEDLYEEALGLARRQGKLALESACLGNLGNVHLCRDNHDEAMKYYRSALEIDERLDNKASLQAWLSNIAHILKSRGDFRGALEHTSTAISMSKSLGDQRLLTHSLGSKCEILRELGEYDGAVEAAREALQIADSIKYSQGMSSARLHLGTALMWAEQAEEAETYCNQALQISRSAGLRRAEAWAHLMIGELLFNGPRSEECLENLSKAADIAGDIGDQDALVRSRAFMIALSARTGDISGPVKEMKHLLSEYENCGDIRIGLFMRRLLGQMLLEGGRSKIEQEQGRELLKEVLLAAESKGLMSEIKRLRILLRQ